MKDLSLAVPRRKMMLRSIPGENIPTQRIKLIPRKGNRILGPKSCAGLLSGGYITLKRLSGA